MTTSKAISTTRRNSGRTLHREGKPTLSHCQLNPPLSHPWDILHAPQNHKHRILADLMHPATGLLHKSLQDSPKLSSNFITIVILLLISSCSTSYKIAVFFFTVVNNYFIALPSINRSSTPLVPILILDSLNELYLTKP